MSDNSPEPADLFASLTFQLEMLRRSARERVEKALAGQGFNLRQYWALVCLVDQDAASQASLGETLNIDRSDMVRLIDSLEHYGLAERLRDPADRRRQIISATKKGRRAHEGLRPLVKTAEIEALSTASPDQLKMLAQFIWDTSEASKGNAN